MGKSKQFASVYKQSNHAHKTGKHRSKGMVAAQTHGRADVKTISKHHKNEMGKADKRHQSKQLRTKKRDEAQMMKVSNGKSGNSPHLVLLLPLHAHTDVSVLSAAIQSAAKSDGSQPSYASTDAAGYTFNMKRFKHRFQIVQPSQADLSLYLDYCQVVDTVLFAVSMAHDEPIDEQGKLVLETLQQAGMSSYMFIGQNLESVAVKKQTVQKNLIKKKLKSLADVKIHVVGNESETFAMLRSVSDHKRKNLGMWHQRTFMLGEKVEFEDGVLKVTGFLRGKRDLDVNKLVHISGWGSYQVKQIDKVAEHCPFMRNDGMTRVKFGPVIPSDFHQWEVIRSRLVASDPGMQEDLKAVNEIDPLNAEQTFPTDDEIKLANQEMITMKKMVPEGSSMYQADWVLTDQGGDWEVTHDDLKAGNNAGMSMDCDSMMGSDDEEEMDACFQPRDEDLESVACSVAPSTIGHLNSVRFDLQPEDDRHDEESYQAFLKEKADENAEYPDEVETPLHIPARKRFERYRGLASYRTTPWDKYEDLPIDYAKIFRLKNFNQMKNYVKKHEPDNTCSMPTGMFVTLHLTGVDATYPENHDASSPLVLFSLFPSEQKMSVLNFALKKSDLDVTVKNKEKLVFKMGFRKFTASPVFSEHTTGNKHKMQRFMPEGGVFIATVFAPITFPPANVLVFREGKEDEGRVASGCLYSVDPNRIITKRVVLTGPAYKINKRSAVIRFMFHNSDDVDWFKSIELRTRRGCRGNILSHIGTHGLMKCKFDKPVTQQDNVMMCLYKRVYPKWTYEEVTPVSKLRKTEEDEMMVV